ncbi:MAG: geranylgeranyl pyrophosphate synthetase [Pirellulaceae bacterium]|nr:MAG: geranylgeranyl pyrophosphate synthetase [Pirellulaceae bacterium]GIW93784.1 MAG: geranylgeranyl pyrophosphate synthetase [Pirellulaceae bacterium]
MTCAVTAENLADFDGWAGELRKEIDAALDRYSRFGEGCPRKLEEAIRYSLLAPGKRLRPLLVLLAAEACGADRQRAMPAACAVEMIHTYSLIHDDLPAMDDDDLRRGRPTCHVRFGEALAILAGDALLARAFEVLAAEIKPPHLAALCCSELGRAAGATALVGGQADDLEAENRPGSFELLESIHRRKTGALFLASLRLGAIVAEADAERLASLDRYGQCLGVAFQIIDDLLDCRNASTRLGKRTGKDQQRGKLTFPALLGLEESRQRAAQLIKEAQAALEPLGAEAGRLSSLAEFVLSRSY